jgi:hypothetical protein
LDLARKRSRLKPDPVAHPEGARGEQHHAGDQVAQRLLGGEPPTASV